MKFNRKILRSAYQNVRQNKKVHQMDTLGYVLFSRCRPRGDTPRYSSFEISSSTRVYVRINYKKKKKRGKSIEYTRGLNRGNKAKEVYYSLNTEELLDLLGKGGTWNRQKKLRGTEHAATWRDTRVHWEMHDSSSGLYEEFCTGPQQFLWSNTAGIWTTFTGTEMKTACWVTVGCLCRFRIARCGLGCAWETSRNVLLTMLLK